MKNNKKGSSGPTNRQIFNAVLRVEKKSDGKFENIYKALGDLGQAVGNGFEQVGKRFNKLEEEIHDEFKDVKKRLDKIEEGMPVDLKLRLGVLERKSGIQAQPL